MAEPCARQDALYTEVAAAFGAAIARLARGYEANAEAARDLEQDIHVALWQSLARFRGEASLSTWVWRVAHNTGMRHIESRSRAKRAGTLIPLEDAVIATGAPGPEESLGAAMALEKLYALIHRLRPADRQVILLYLEALDARAIGEITGLAPRAVATRIHRIKALLARRFDQGNGNDN